MVRVDLILQDLKINKLEKFGRKDAMLHKNLKRRHRPIQTASLLIETPSVIDELSALNEPQYEERSAFTFMIYL